MMFTLGIILILLLIIIALILENNNSISSKVEQEIIDEMLHLRKENKILKKQNKKGGK